MWTIPSLLCIAGMLASTAAPAGGEAATSASKRLIRLGNALLDQGAFEEALRKFEEAYQYFSSPKIFFNQGQALQGLDRNLDALRAYRRFLTEAKDAEPEVRAEAERQIADLTGKLGRADIRSNRPGALIRIDGEEQGTTPLPEPVFVQPGNHEVIVGWEGETKSLALTAPAGAIVTAEVTFAPRPGAVQLACNREGAVVRIDGAEVGKTPLGRPLSLAPGQHTLAVKWQEENKTQEFALAEGETASLAVAFADSVPPVIIQPPRPLAPKAKPWYRSGWVWVAGGAVVVAAATTLALVYGSHDRYPSNTLGSQSIGD